MSCPDCAKATAAVEALRGALEDILKTAKSVSHELDWNIDTDWLIARVQAALAQHPAGGKQ